MGCTSSSAIQEPPKAQPKPAQPKKQINRDMLVVSNKKGEEIRRNTGDIDGNQFQADNLENCQIIINDFVDSITIDQCYNCKFAISAVKGSIFMRDCQECKVTINCGQFRCRNCTDCDFFVHSRTSPVIEASSKLRIGCGTYSYEGVLDHLAKAQIDPYANCFDDVHDFTQNKGNFELVPGQKLNLDIAGEPKYIPFFWPMMPGITPVTKRINESKYFELVQISLDDGVKLVSLKKEGNILVASFDGTESDVSAKLASIL
ncbi:XRP2, putative [Trichomonas vaginalis G3]|uniref:XRP2, putative n=1 Tax=Trichomonas vaginalis (strain ATCC PRA-98 / G3) TaxID=412133 RepID=A2DGT7_TRIV3|nr:post-chaperonin tubulin folding pathway [Trichomonas vaginalis G3]EAY20474.1 XRP2, putative [Trichomonas vaginalis G3]KAI5490472.1 post-chaperonin tubulin folding pathway [Trichomonas vaginalis G3]|eukprot:XP_001581460.1 XRP2 [Trichomonas vaginalis G3]